MIYKAILFTLLALLLASCKPPPVQVGIVTTDSSYCVTLEPDSIPIGPASVDIDGDKIVICYPREK